MATSAICLSILEKPIPLALEYVTTATMFAFDLSMADGRRWLYTQLVDFRPAQANRFSFFDIKMKCVILKGTAEVFVRPRGNCNVFANFVRTTPKLKEHVGLWKAFETWYLCGSFYSAFKLSIRTICISLQTVSKACQRPTRPIQGNVSFNKQSWLEFSRKIKKIYSGVVKYIARQFSKEPSWRETNKCCLTKTKKEIREHSLIEFFTKNRYHKVCWLQTPQGSIIGPK